MFDLTSFLHALRLCWLSSLCVCVEGEGMVLWVVKALWFDSASYMCHYLTDFPPLPPNTTFYPTMAPNCTPSSLSCSFPTHRVCNHTGYFSTFYFSCLVLYSSLPFSYPVRSLVCFFSLSLYPHTFYHVTTRLLSPPISLFSHTFTLKEHTQPRIIFSVRTWPHMPLLLASKWYPGLSNLTSQQTPCRLTKFRKWKARG